MSLKDPGMSLGIRAWESFWEGWKGSEEVEQVDKPGGNEKEVVFRGL